MKRLIAFLFILSLSFTVFAEKVRIIDCVDGTVMRLRVGKNARRLPNETDAQRYQRAMDYSMEVNSNLKGRPYMDIEESDIRVPGELKRNAWVFNVNTQKVEIDEVKAEKIKNDRAIALMAHQLEEETNRKNAIKKLKAEGKLPSNYTE